MSVFKKIKGLFIEEEAGDKKSKPVQEINIPDEPQEVSASTSANIPDVNLDTTPTQKTGKPDDKFVDILLKAVEKNNMEGFDYLEYKSSLQSLAGMDMDEPTKYKSALAMAKTMGATPDNLIASARFYLDVLKKENVKFKTALKNQRTKQVSGREGEINKTLKLIESKKQKIAQLEKEIAADTKNLETLKAGINKAAAKVQSTSDNFNYAFNVVTGQIQEDIVSMKKFLK